MRRTIRTYVPAAELRAGDLVLHDLHVTTMTDFPQRVLTSAVPADPRKPGYCPGQVEFSMRSTAPEWVRFEMGASDPGVPYRMPPDQTYILVERDGIRFSYDDEVFQ